MIYSEEIKTLNDFRNNLVDLDFNHRSKVNDEEIKVLDCLCSLFHIPREADIQITYDVGEAMFVLSSDIELNIHNVDGFRLLREEMIRTVDYRTYSSLVDEEIVFKYYFQM